MTKTAMEIADEQIVEKAFNKIATDEPMSHITRADVQMWLKLLRPLITERLVVSAPKEGARTWIGGESVSDLLDTINGYLEDGYAPEDLVLEGLTS